MWCFLLLLCLYCFFFFVSVFLYCCVNKFLRHDVLWFVHINSYIFLLSMSPVNLMICGCLLSVWYQYILFYMPWISLFYVLILTYIWYRIACFEIRLNKELLYRVFQIDDSRPVYLKYPVLYYYILHMCSVVFLIHHFRCRQNKSFVFYAYSSVPTKISITRLKILIKF